MANGVTHDCFTNRHLRNVLARVCRRSAPAELEQWIYAHDAELEALLPDDVYLDLIALDFADKWALHEVES